MRYINLQRIPRQIVYVVLLICISIPFFIQCSLPVFVSNATKGYHNAVEKTHQKSPAVPVIIMSMWGPGTRGENRPQLLTTILHLFELRQPFVVFSPILDPLAPRMTQEVFREAVKTEKERCLKEGIPFDLEYGTDYANLGFKGIAGPTIAPIIQALDSDFKGLVVKDFYGTPINSLPVMSGMYSLADFSLIIAIGSGSEAEDIIGVFSPVHPTIPVIVGAWSLVCTKLYPYFDSGQFAGLLDGLNGASEYMTILDPTVGSSRRINSLSWARSMIIILIIIGNIGMFIDRARRRRGITVEPPPIPMPGEKAWLNKASAIMCILFVLLLIAEMTWSLSHGGGWSWARAGMWSAAFCTIGILTFAFGDNKLYRILEHVIIGSAAAYGLYEVIDKQFYPNFIANLIGGFKSLSASGPPPIEGGAWNILWLLVLIPSFLWFTVYFKRLAWTNKIVVGMLMGVTVGISFEKFTNLSIPQIMESFKPLLTYATAGVIPGTILIRFSDSCALTGQNVLNFIYIATMVLVLLYFVFCFTRRSATARGVTRLGRVLMMVAFGALFGNTVATRMTWLIDRLETLVEWLQSFSFWQ